MYEALLNRFYNLLYRLGIEQDHDKIAHLIVGFIVGAVSMYLIGDIRALLPVIVVAGGKELYDQLEKMRGFDVLDFLSTVFGGAMGIITLSVIGG